MIIAVDIGNSAAKAALVDGDRIHESGRLDTSAASTADLADGLRVLAGSAPQAATAILAVSVVDRWTERLERAADELGLPLTVVAASHIPLQTALLRPDRTGTDRLLAAWAAVRLHGSPVIVIDLGTATTVDAVDGDGFFLGGAILPGLGLAAETLAQGTARLPHVELDLPERAIGADTTAALQSGIVIGHVGAVRELVQRIRDGMAGVAAATLSPTPAAASDSAGLPAARVVVTGGHSAASWARRAWCEPAGPALPAVADVLDPELVLRGLGLLAEHLATRTGSGAD
jgi:type III pantothenate kinase